MTDLCVNPAGPPQTFPTSELRRPLTRTPINVSGVLKLPGDWKTEVVEGASRAFHPRSI